MPEALPLPEKSIQQFQIDVRKTVKNALLKRSWALCSMIMCATLHSCLNGSVIIFVK